jgi:lipoate-protein ligase A
MPASECQTLTWTHFVDAAGLPGARNMAIDHALLEASDRSGAAFLRLYRWTPPCLSFGRNEPALTRYDRAAIERLGLDVVRRPTGGRAVWHEHEVTYAVAGPVAWFGSLRQSYRAIHERLAVALRSLGVPATLAPDTRHLTPAGPCFAEPVGGEIVVAGRKLVGSAQVRHGSAFLQHGSILLDGSQDVIGAISRQPSAIRSTTLREVLGRSVTFQEVADAVVHSWDPAATGTALFRPRSSSSVDFGSAWTWRR